VQQFAVFEMLGEHGFGIACGARLPGIKISALAFGNRVKARLEHGCFFMCKRSNLF